MSNAPAAASRPDRLTTWKEIAAFLGRDERTVKRWEATRGMPIRRAPGARSTVFASRAELESWLVRAAPERAEIAAPEPPAQVPSGLRRRSGRRGLPWIAGGMAAVVAVVAALLASAIVSERQAKAPPASTEPELYSRAVYLMNTRTRSGLEAAITDFSRVILARPNYAPAYAGLASSYNLMTEFGGMPANEGFAQAKVAARRAIELDPGSATARRSLAFAEFWGSHETAAAVRDLRLSLQLDPRDATTHHWYANVLAMMGDSPRAQSEFLEAERLDPTSTSIRIDHANSLLAAGRPDLACDLLASIISAHPEDAWAMTILSRAEVSRGHYEAMVAAMTRAADLADDAKARLIAEAARRALIDAGPSGMRRAILDRREALYNQSGYGAYDLAVSFADVDPPRALALLGKIEASGDAAIMGVRADRRFARLRGDPRFKALLARLGLPPVAA